MALTNFFLVTTEEHDPAVRRAGWLYLLYSHVTILGLFAFFVPAALADRGVGFGPLPAAVPASVRSALFVLALVGRSA